MMSSSSSFWRSSSATPTPAKLAHFADQRALTLEAMRRAGQLRQHLCIELWDAVCPFNIAQRLGVEVRFQNIPSMDGMYCQLRERPLIVLASERPAGRQNFNCAHELGHHEFGHGTRLDEFLDEDSLQLRAQAGERRGQPGRPFDPDEFIADRFASFLLMPKAAVDRAFGLRGLNLPTSDPLHIYTVAGYLGVGYRTLVEHLYGSLKALSPMQVEELRQARLPKLRAAIVGQPVKQVIVVDEHWENRPLDLRVGDLALVPSEWDFEGACLTVEIPAAPGLWQQGLLVRAVRQGQGTLLRSPDEAPLSVRVSRQGYVGRSLFRHLDDPDDDLGEDVVESG
jgi:Zn-dependent peptidase ImmA (M78 family)